jgi:glycosyltransferase involved in cell wall biosynthesis
MSGLSPPLVSVVIPCHNQARFLGEALNSTVKQSYGRIEIIVVDDGSDDDVNQVIRAHHGISYIRQARHGVSRARNVGFSHSHGNYLVFLDADDRLLPDAIEIGVGALSTRTDHAFAFGLFVAIGTSQGLRDLRRDRNYDYQELLKWCFIGTPGAVLYHRWVFERVGGFDELNDSAADYDFYLRVAREFPIFCHHRPVVEYRRHDSNMSNDPGLMLKGVLNALAKQYKYAKSHEALRYAYKSGCQHWRDFYGEPLVSKIYENLKRRRLVDAIRDFYVLLGYYPTRFPIFATRKLKKLRQRRN